MTGQKNGISSSASPVDHNLAILGHELGNVLNGILGMAELLGDSGLTAEQQRWLGAIEQSGRQMQSLIRAVRPHGNAKIHDVVPYPCRVDGMEMLEHVVISHTPAARSRKNRLLLVTHTNLERYWFLDSCLLRQVLDNLVSNAIKFTFEGEIIVEVASAPAMNNGEEALSIKVSDTGPGFDTAAAKHLFRAYTRCNTSQAGQPEGRGLGLYICRNILRAMQGRISCSSPASGGACFEIVLPGTLQSGKVATPVLRSELAAQVCCELKLANPMRRSVDGFLARLGVRRGDTSSQMEEQGLALVISEVPPQLVKSSSGIILTPRDNPGPVPRIRMLEAPVLESSLGRLLLELALEWRSLVLRNESQGSTPTQR